MSHRKLRHSAKSLILLCCAVMVCGESLAAAHNTKGTNASKRFRFEAISEKSLGLWEGEHRVLVYNHGVIASTSAPNAKARSSYFHPVYGLDGEVLTDDFPKDHVNHRGLHWAWPHIKIDDQEVDLWSLRDIRHEFQRWLARETTAKGAVLGMENGWFVGDKRVLLEKVWARIHPAGSHGRFIDLELSLTPEGKPISLWGAEGKSYGGLTLRFGPRTKTIITVPSGRSKEDLLVAPLPWADLSGDLKGVETLSGAAVFVHPKHPDYPPTWMTREYGLLAVGWPGITPQSLPAGKTISLSYRIWIHRGVPEPTEIQKVYDAYRNRSKN